MNVAVLVKQVPQVDSLELGPGGRLRRAHVVLEMNPYCRRAVSQGVELVRHLGGRRAAGTGTNGPGANSIGRSSVDADTGQVGPQIAELLDLPFAAYVRHMEVGEGSLTLDCEVDDGCKRLRLGLPAVMSVAERLCQPAKVPPQQRAEVPATRLRRFAAADLGPGPWGAAGSLTAVGETRVLDVGRCRPPGLLEASVLRTGRRRSDHAVSRSGGHGPTGR